LSNALRVQMALLPLRDPDVTATLVDGARIAANLPESQLGKEFVRCWGGQGLELIRKVQTDAKVYRTPTPRELGKEGSTHTEPILRYLRLQERLLGPQHPALVDTCTRLGEAAGAELRPAERLESARIGEQITRATSPHNVTAILMFQQQESIALLDLGRTAEAAAIAKDALDQRMKMPAGVRDALMTAMNHRDLAWFEVQDGQYEAALASAQTAITLLKGIVGERHHTVAVAQIIEAHCLMQGGDLGRAQQITAQALKNIDGKAATPDDQLAHVQVARGLVLYRLDRYSEARELFESAWEKSYRLCGAGHTWRARMCEAMADITLAEQDYTAAPLWLSRAAGNIDPPDSGEMSSITGEDVK
jgi:tetratricopeptide (TPR) repeat protein